VQRVAAHTEADPAAILFTLLGAVGNIAGGGRSARIHDDHHPAKLFVAIVGDTASGSKGTSNAVIRPLLRRINDKWFNERNAGGFGSGEAIVSEFAPRVIKNSNGEETGLEFPDPRLFVYEPEFARILAVAAKDGSILSMMMRCGYDGTPIATRRAQSKIVVNYHHISVLAHVTPRELRERLSTSEMANGFANRFLFVASKRSKQLPFGGDISDEVYEDFAATLRMVGGDCEQELVIDFASDARELWAKLYNAEADRDGIVGDLTARHAAQRLRLAVTFALFDGSATIGAAHVAAAEACWRYSVASVEHIFGGMRGDNVQDRLLEAARTAYPSGLTSTEVHQLFGKNAPAARIKVAKTSLVARNLLRTEKTTALKGAPTETVFAVPLTNERI